MEIHHLSIVTSYLALLLLFRVSLRKTMFLNKMMLLFLFHFHLVLPSVDVGDVVCGDVG